MFNDSLVLLTSQHFIDSQEGFHTLQGIKYEMWFVL